MNKKDELTPQERKLLQEFKACNNEAERREWIQKNRDLFQPAPEQRDKMAFYSGGIAGSNRRDAEIHCERHSAVILEHTSGGKILDKAKLYDTLNDKPQANRIFITASEHYVESAQGRVRTFTMHAREERVFIDKELPKLLHNKDVTHINEVPRRDLLKMWHSDPSPEKQEARKEVAREINQGVKQIGWDGLPQQRREKADQTEKEISTKSKTFEIELSNGEKRLLEVEKMNPNEKLEDLNLRQEHLQQLNKQKPDEALRLNADDLRDDLKREQMQDKSQEQADKARIFEVELSKGEKRLLEVEGLNPNQSLKDLKTDRQLAEDLQKQKPDEALKIKVNEQGEIQRQQKQEQEQTQNHRYGH